LLCIAKRGPAVILIADPVTDAINGVDEKLAVSERERDGERSKSERRAEKRAREGREYLKCSGRGGRFESIGRMATGRSDWHVICRVTTRPSRFVGTTRKGL